MSHQFKKQLIYMVKITYSVGAVYIQKRAHYTAFIYCRKNDLFYYYDALSKSFSPIKDSSMQNVGQLSIITYFRTITKPEHQKLKIFSIATKDDLESGSSLK